MSRYALLVGINDYARDSGLSSLRYAENDALELGRTLRDRCGFKVTTLVGREATRDAIELGLQESGSGDTFVFFFAGHGSKIHGRDHLHPVDSKAGGFRALALDQVSGLWKDRFSYRKVLAVLDACRNELGARGSRGG